MDFAADKVIAKYQAATCAQLRQQKNEPKTEKEKAAIEFLRNDSQAREAFINKVAAPVANECGLIRELRAALPLIPAQRRERSTWRRQRFGRLR